MRLIFILFTFSMAISANDYVCVNKDTYPLYYRYSVLKEDVVIKYKSIADADDYERGERVNIIHKRKGTKHSFKEVMFNQLVETVLVNPISDIRKTFTGTTHMPSNKYTDHLELPMKLYCRNILGLNTEFLIAVDKMYRFIEMRNKFDFNDDISKDNFKFLKLVRGKENIRHDNVMFMMRLTTKDELLFEIGQGWGRFKECHVDVIFNHDLNKIKYYTDEKCREFDDYN